MPESEIAILLEALAKQVQLCLEQQDKLRDFVQIQVERMQHMLEQYVTKERVMGVERNVHDLEKKIEAMEQRILDNQNANYRRTIRAQYAILSTIVLGVIGYLVNYILGIIFHH